MVAEIIRVENLVKSYKKSFIPQKVQALRGASFVVKSGRITGFIGANGAGKTTTLRCILEFTSVDSGQFSFFGSQGLKMEVRKKIGYLPEHPHFYGFLSGLEFLRFYAELSGVRKSNDELLQALANVKLEHAAHRALSSYSKGMLQRAGLAQALIHEPELLILDEPMSGLDPDGRRLVRDILKEVAGRGVSIFFSTHLLEDVENLCEDLVLMSAGRVVYNGDTQSILSSGTKSCVLSFKDATGRVLSKECKDEEDLNSEISRVLSQGGKIQEARWVKSKLEDVFAQWTRDFTKEVE